MLDFLWRVIMIFVLRVASGFNVRKMGKTLANSHLTLIFHPVMMILTDFTIQSDFTMFFIKVAQPHQAQLMVKHVTHESCQVHRQLKVVRGKIPEVKPLADEVVNLREQVGMEMTGAQRVGDKNGEIMWVLLKMLCTPKPNGFADHYPYEKWLFHWEYTLFSDKPMYNMISPTIIYIQFGAV